MKRRLTAAAVIGVSSVLALTACGSSNSTGSSGSSGANGQVTLKLVAADYGTGGANSGKAYWDGVVQGFEAQHSNIKVDVTVINWNDIDNQVATMVQNGQQPDILETGDYAGFVKDNLLYPVSDVLSAGTIADLIPSFSDKGKVNGTAYGIPWTASARALFYNKDLVPTPPATWDQLKTDAAAVKAKGKVGFGLPLGPEEAQAETLLWTLGNGGGYKDPTGKWIIDSQANIDTFTWLQDNLVKPGLTEPDPATKNRTDVWKDFAAGKIGLINGSPSLLPIIKATNPNLNFGVTPIAGKTGALTTTLGVEDWLMAFNKGGHKDQVKTFLDYAYGVAPQVGFDKEYSLLPITKSASTQLSSDPNFKPFLDALPNATFYPFTDPAWSAVNTAIKQTIGKAVTTDPKSVLSQLQQTAVKGR